LGSTTFTSYASFPPAILTVDPLIYNSNVVYTKTVLPVKFRSPISISTGSIVSMQFPYFVSGDSSSAFLSASSGIGAGSSQVTLIDKTDGATFQTLQLEVKADISAGGSLSFDLTDVYTPLSTSPVGGIKASILTADKKEYLSGLAPAVSVTVPRQFTSLIVTQGDRTVSRPSDLSVYFKVDTNGLPGSYIIVTSTGGIALDQVTISSGYTREIISKTSVKVIPPTSIQAGSGNFFTLSNVINDIKTAPATITLTLRDSQDKDAQISSPASLTFIPATVSPVSVSFNPSTLATRSTLALSFTTTVNYEAGATIKLTSPSGFKTDGAICTVSGATVGACSYNSIDQSLTMTTTAPIVKGTLLSFSVQNVLTPTCASSSSVNFGATVTSYDSRGIEGGTGTFSTSALNIMALSTSPVTSSDPSTGSTASNSFTITHSGILTAGSYIEVQMPLQITWISGISTCTSTGVFSCSLKTGSSSILVLGPLTSDKLPSSGIITVQINSLVNPRTLGNYVFQLTLFQSSTCTYGSGSSQLAINRIAELKLAQIEPLNRNQYAWVPYTITIRPNSDVLYTGDYIEFTIPDYMAFSSSSLQCSAISANLIDTSCSLLTGSTNIIKVNFMTSPSYSSANKDIKFNISFVMNPIEGTNYPGFIFKLKTSSGSDFERITITSGLYTRSILPVLTMEPQTNYRGLYDSTTFSMTQATFLPENTIIIVSFSQKFATLDNLVLKESTPNLILDQNDKINRKVYLRLASAAPFNSTLSYTLMLNNPTSELVGREDILADLYVADPSKAIYQATPFLDVKTIQFVCNKTCKDCRNFWNYCTACFPEYDLKDGVCTLRPIIIPPPIIVKKDEVSYPFIFLGIGLLLTLIMIILGGCLGFRNYWGNFLYSLLKFNMAVFFAVFAYFVYTNEHPIWLWYGVLAIYGVHVLISCVTLIVVLCGLRKSSKEVPATKAVPKSNINQPSCWFYFMFLLVPVFSHSILRWFFSAGSDHRGCWWGYDKNTFNFVKSALHRFQMLYLFVVIIALIILTSISLSLNIYLFKMEMIALCVLDTVVYMWAYFELSPFCGRTKELAKEEAFQVTQIKGLEKVGYLPGKGDKSMVEQSMLYDEEKVIGTQAYSSAPKLIKNFDEKDKSKKYKDKLKRRQTQGNDDGSVQDGDSHEDSYVDARGEESRRRLKNVYPLEDGDVVDAEEERSKTTYALPFSKYKDDPYADGDVEHMKDISEVTEKTPRAEHEVVTFPPSKDQPVDVPKLPKDRVQEIRERFNGETNSQEENLKTVERGYGQEVSSDARQQKVSQRTVLKSQKHIQIEIGTPIDVLTSDYLGNLLINNKSDYVIGSGEDVKLRTKRQLKEEAKLRNSSLKTSRVNKLSAKKKKPGVQRRLYKYDIPLKTEELNNANHQASQSNTSQSKSIMDQGTDVPEFDIFAPYEKPVPCEIKEEKNGVFVPVISRRQSVMRANYQSQIHLSQLEDGNPSDLNISTSNYSKTEQKRAFTSMFSEIRSNSEQTRKVDQLNGETDLIVSSQHKPLQSMTSNLKRPDKRVQGLNADKNHWWFSNSPNYLEIIYEENDKDSRNLYENPTYDEPGKKRWGREGEKEFWHKHMHKEIGLPVSEEDGDFSKEHSKDGGNLPERTVGEVGAQEKLIQKVDIGKGDEDGAEGNNEVSVQDEALEQMLREKESSVEWGDEPKPTKRYKIIPIEEASSQEEAELDNPKDSQVTYADIVEFNEDSSVRSVNGQAIEDLENHVCKDRDGITISIPKQYHEDLLRGVLVDDTGRRFFANFHSKGDLEKGIIRTQNGKPLLIKSQSFQEMDEHGVLRDLKGKIVEINGQKASDLANGIVKADNGRVEFKISDQTAEKLALGVLVTAGRKEIRTCIPQTMSDFKKGLIKDEEGYLRRLIDQTAEELSQGQLQDRSLLKQREQVSKRNQAALLPKTDRSSKLERIFERGTTQKNTTPESGSSETTKKAISKENCYYDEKGQPILAKNLTFQTKLYDSLGNPVVRKQSEYFLFDKNGELINNSNTDQVETLFNQDGKPLSYNALGPFTKFYNRQGALVDYKLLDQEEKLYDEDGNGVNFDMLDRTRPLFDEAGGRLSPRTVKTFNKPIHDERRSKLTALDQVKSQRLYSKEGKLLGPYDFMSTQPIFDKKGRKIGEVINPTSLNLPLFFDSQTRPVDIRDAVRKYLFSTPDGTPMTREDLENECKAFNAAKQRLTPAEFNELLDDPSPLRRIFDEDGKETSVDRLIREKVPKDRLKRLVDADKLRRQGKLFDVDKKAVTGAVLARVGAILEQAEQLYPQEGDDERVIELGRTQPRGLGNTFIANSKKLDPTVSPVKDAPADSLQLALRADESFDLDLHVQEVSDSQDMGHEIVVDDPSSYARVTGTTLNRGRFPNNGRIASSRTHPRFPGGFDIPEGDEEALQSRRFHQLGMDKLRTNPDWKEPRAHNTARHTDTDFFRFNPHNAESSQNLHTHFDQAESIGSSQPRTLRLTGVPTAKPKLPLEIKKLNMPPRAESQGPKKMSSTLHGNFVNPAQTGIEKVSFVRRLDTKPLKRADSSQPSIRGDSLKEIYIDSKL
jgi:hypothetical protein